MTVSAVSHLRKETNFYYMKTIDLVVPCYNEEEMIELFYQETDKVVSQISGYSFHYILIDDGSKDSTFQKMKQLAQNHQEISYITFSRNFGKEAAMYAGLCHSTGDYVVVMDADLQHPPQMIPDFIAGIEEGYDCVSAMRSNRNGESRIRSFFSRQFYKLSNWMSDVKMAYGAVDYRMMTRQMVDSILELSEVQRFSKGIFMWVGYNTKWIPYENVERLYGTTKWSFWGLFKYAIDGITSFSITPLRFLSGMGFVISLVAFIYIIITLIQTLIIGVDVPGYATTLCTLLFLGGIIELSIGILGEYISRIYLETKDRPIYIIRQTNIKKESDNEGKDM